MSNGRRPRPCPASLPATRSAIRSPCRRRRSRSDSSFSSRIPARPTARITVQSVDIVTGTTGPLTSLGIDLPDRKAQQLTIASVSPTPLSDGLVQVDIQTVPPLTPLGVRDPAAMLLLTLPDGTSENY